VNVTVVRANCMSSAPRDASESFSPSSAGICDGCVLL
jgi:hypothetical protein